MLTDVEVKAVWAALDSEPVRIAAIFKLALLTGQRRGEICGRDGASLTLIPAGGAFQPSEPRIAWRIACRLDRRLLRFCPR